MLAFVMKDAVKEHSMDKHMGTNKEKKKKESSCCEARALKNAQTPFSPLFLQKEGKTVTTTKSSRCAQTPTQKTHTHTFPTLLLHCTHANNQSNQNQYHQH